MRKITLALCLMPFSLFACQDCIDYAAMRYCESFKRLRHEVLSENADPKLIGYVNGQCEAYLDIYNEMMTRH